MKLKLAMTAVAVFLSGAAFAADPIKIGLSGPFTGGSSSMGGSMRDGGKLAVDEINKAGGGMGRRNGLVRREDEAKKDMGGES